MDANISDFKANVTIDQIVEFFNISVNNFTNESEVSQIHLFDLYEAYKTKEKEQLLMYKWVAYILGSLIILSNLTVVISSGLILRKGQQPKSTYLLLGNVSLADTIIGISIIFGATVDNSLGNNQLCMFQLGMLVCPAMVSIFSVGLIAVDRYIYILHGLYYQRWFNTTRVRIGIVFIWLIGLVLGFLPAAGWIQDDPITSRCIYVSVYPGALILFNAALSIIPIVMVAILYTIILLYALKNVRNIKASESPVNYDAEADEKPRLRISRGNTKTINYKTINKQNTCRIKRSASFHNCDIKAFNSKILIFDPLRSKSTDDLSVKTNSSQVNVNKLETQKRSGRDSNFSISTVETSCTIENSLRDVAERSVRTLKSVEVPYKKCGKAKGPKKCRAVTVVMLTSGSFIITWLPFFIFVIFFVLCEEKRTNPRCLNMLSLLGGPLCTLAFINSVLNPLIYAWWHKRFKESIKSYFWKYVQRYLSARSLRNSSSTNSSKTCCN